MQDGRKAQWAAACLPRTRRGNEAGEGRHVARLKADVVQGETLEGSEEMVQAAGYGIPGLEHVRGGGR